MPDVEYPPLVRAPDVPLDKIEWRVDGKPAQRGNESVSRFVPYIDAAEVADLLDEWVGPARWKDLYEQGTIKGTEVLWCYLSVEVQPGVWVTKQDVGKPSQFEAEKGAVSDAFKRAACLKWGVGRNVYDVPGDLWAPCRTYESGGKTYAAPNDRTIPALLEQLRQRGYTTDGVRVAGADEPDAAPGSDGQDADQARIRNELLESFQQLPKNLQDEVLARLRKAEIIKRATAGAIGTVAPEHFDKVRGTLNAAHESLRPPPAGEGAGPAEATPAPAGSAPPPVTADGEKWSIEQLREGIEAYRIALTDEQLAEFVAWCDEHVGDAQDHDAWMAAYEHIAAMVAGVSVGADDA